MGETRHVKEIYHCIHPILAISLKEIKFSLSILCRNLFDTSHEIRHVGRWKSRVIYLLGRE